MRFFVALLVLFSLVGPARAANLADLAPGAAQQRRIAAIDEIGRTRDRVFAAPLIDLLRFANSVEEVRAILTALRSITGLPLADPASVWEQTMVWYGRQGGIDPPPGYLEWKGELHARAIDPAFRRFFPQGAVARIRVEEIVWGGVVPDGIPALNRPQTLTARAARYLDDEEPVFGVHINGEARAYPLRILDWHEMANDVVGGVPIALAYCTLCGSGILYDARAGGRTFEFGSSGLLYRSNKLMFDRETGTLWNHMTGEPVLGELADSGIRLTVLPVVIESWGAWRKRHPETRVLALETGHARRYAPGAAYGKYFASPGTMFPVWQRSEQMPAKARVFALRLGDAVKAYPLDELNRAGGVANDRVGNTRIVVVHRDAVGRVRLPESWIVVLRRVQPGASPDANDLSLEVARKVLDTDPHLVASLKEETWLAMPTATRLALLNERTGDGWPAGAIDALAHVDRDTRDRVAARGLIGDARAYASGGRRFASGPAADEVVDEHGARWRVTEDALVAPTGERLERLPGHLAFWLGWFAFYPHGDVYLAPRR